MKLKHMYQIKLERADGSPVVEGNPSTEAVVTVFSRRERRQQERVLDEYGPDFVSYVRDCGWIRVDA